MTNCYLYRGQGDGDWLSRRAAMATQAITAILRPNATHSTHTVPPAFCSPAPTNPPKIKLPRYMSRILRDRLSACLIGPNRCGSIKKSIYGEVSIALGISGFPDVRAYMVRTALMRHLKGIRGSLTMTTCTPALAPSIPSKSQSSPSSTRTAPLVINAAGNRRRRFWTASDSCNHHALRCLGVWPSRGTRANMMANRRKASNDAPVNCIFALAGCSCVMADIRMNVLLGMI